MNDSMMIVAGIVAVVAVVGFFLYGAFRGVHGSLTTAKVGDIYNFEYEQPHHGEPERVLAKVIRPVWTLERCRMVKLGTSMRSVLRMCVGRSSLDACSVPQWRLCSKNLTETLAPKLL